MITDKIYHGLPVFAQNLVCSFYGMRERKIRLGGDFRDKYEWLLESESASRAHIDAYQDQQIASLIQHAYNTVPFYRRIMDERGLVPGAIESRRDLEKLPILTKEDVIKYKNELRSTSTTSGRVLARKTSGTTGTALGFLTTAEAIAFQWAVWWRHRARFGISPDNLSLNFTGKLVVPPAQSAPPYWRWNWPMRQALLTMQHVNREKIADIAQFAGAHPFRFYSGYPSIIHAFAELIDERGLELRHRPSHVFLGAENLQAYQKAMIEKVTGAHVSDQYGFSEGCGNASRCETGPYHEDWEFGVLEVLNPQPADNNGTGGRVLATGFSNMAFPFIRYDVGDVAVWESPDYQCSCGRASRVIRSIDGRCEDYVETPEGLRIMRFDYIFKDAAGIREAQVIQSQLGEIVIRYVPRESYSPRDEAAVRNKVRDWISPRLQVRFERVPMIERGANGKFRPVVSEVSKAPPVTLAGRHHENTGK